ncbi:MAG: DNA polymerase III subunit epsilon [Pseudomonadota bacterium]|mgnify:CR=1 FL=1|nr:DNA polymerase III subunit epsilon [Pseudomonadota bacterium]MEC8665467.1 DNA polymerase III subunit epsilon [Pseudomonadota bacterium]
MREIVFDTETTGMDPTEGDKLVEIGCVELVNQVPTGRTYHQYINPERDIPADAIAVHGITNDRVKDEPVFEQIYADFVEFVGDAKLVAHNATFDMKFINYQLKEVGHAPYDNKRVVDTLAIARQKYPGSPASLDALCRRFGIDLSSRELHGALLDAQLLADVYLELMGGRQHGLLDMDGGNSNDKSGASALVQIERPFREPRPHAANEDELAAHEKLLEELKDPVWKHLA